MPYKDAAKKKAADRGRQRSRRNDPQVRYDEAQQKRSRRAGQATLALLVDAPVNQLELGSMDDVDIKDEWIVAAMNLAFKKATRDWVKANPTRSRAGKKGWAGDVRASRSVSQTREREYDDELYVESDGNRRATQPPDDDENDEGAVLVRINAIGFLERNRSGAEPSEVPTFYVIGRDSRRVPSTLHPAAELDQDWPDELAKVRKRMDQWMKARRGDTALGKE